MEEYAKVQQQFKDKGVKRVPLFIANEITVRSYLTLISIGRLLILLNIGYLGLTGTNIVLAKLAKPEMLYLCTGAVTLLNAFYHYYLRRA
jgi:hypothetical protein